MHFAMLSYEHLFQPKVNSLTICIAKSPPVQELLQRITFILEKYTVTNTEEL